MNNKSNEIERQTLEKCFQKRKYQLFCNLFGNLLVSIQRNVQDHAYVLNDFVFSEIFVNEMH